MTQTTDWQDAAPPHDLTPETSASHTLAADDREASAAVEGTTPRNGQPSEPEALVSITTAEAVEELAEAIVPATAAVVDEHGRDAPLLDSDLEDGIASIFAALHSATDGSQEFVATAERDSEDDGDSADVDLSTFRLLGELDRLWHRAA